MIFEVYDALKEAGASEQKAKAAAESVASYESRFNKVESDLLLIKRMLGFVLAGVAALILKVLFLNFISFPLSPIIFFNLLPQARIYGQQRAQKVSQLELYHTISAR